MVLRADEVALSVFEEIDNQHDEKIKNRKTDLATGGELKMFTSRKMVSDLVKKPWKKQGTWSLRSGYTPNGKSKIRWRNSRTSLWEIPISITRWKSQMIVTNTPCITW